MYVKSVLIDSIKNFDKVEFDFERPGKTFPGWTVFVGGNSSGKSTILRAIALALLGPDEGRQLMGNTTGWIKDGKSKATVIAKLTWDESVDTFKEKGKRKRDGVISAGVRWTKEKQSDHFVTFHSVDKPVEGIVERSTTTASNRSVWNPNSKGWFSAGYGPMRRLTGGSSESMRYSVVSGAVSRFVTLFREDAALSESEEWLRKMYARTLESKNPVMKDCLTSIQTLMGEDLLPQGMKISRISVDHVWVKDRRGVELPMRDISDGCRSLYATILDLIHSFIDVYGEENLFTTDENGKTIVDRPGVVIIDEVEAHLHPAWQLAIPQWLKTHFPKVQFLVSTHSPLVAQSADPNGVFVLPLQNDVYNKPRAMDHSEYERLILGKAEKTLLGTAFGLQTTRTLQAQQRIARWQELDSKKRAVNLSTVERKEYTNLKKDMEIVFQEEGLAL